MFVRDMFGTKILPNANVDYLNEALLYGAWDDGEMDRLKLLPAVEYEKFNRDHLMVWMVKTGRYNLPTVELVEWLREQIGDRTVIEAGAGCADLSYHLGIQATDSFMQHRPEIKLYYQALGQQVTEPPEDVLKFDAVEAVEHFKPQVVVASWLTQKIDEKEWSEDSQGNIWGADEGELIGKVDCYIHIGNERVHGRKSALSIPHKEYRPPWLVSRGIDQSQNVIYIWGE